MEKKKKIVVIAIVLGVFLMSFISALNLLQVSLASIIEYLIIAAVVIIAIIVFLFQGVGNMVVNWYLERTAKRQQEKKRLLIEAFHNVKLNYDKDEVTCEYPRNSDFLKIPLAKEYLKERGVLDFFERFEIAAVDYNEKIKIIQEHLDSVVNGTAIKVSNNLTAVDLNKNVDFPDYYFIPSHVKTVIMDAVMDTVVSNEQRIYLEVYQDSVGYMLLAKIPDGKGGINEYNIGRETESGINKVEDFVQQQIDDGENRRLALMVLDSKHDMKNAEEVFNKKLATIVNELRFSVEAQK